MKNHDERSPVRTATSPTLKRIGALTAGSALLAGAMIAVSPAGPANAATSQTFSYTGAQQTYTAFGGVQKLSVVAEGAQGAAGGAVGGTGGITSGTVDLGGATTMDVWVGGAGSGATGGFNGGGNGGTGANSGGGGGGASDVRVADTRVLIAPGGGGGGGDAGKKGQAGNGGNGNQAGTAGSAGTNNDKGDGDGGAAANVSGGNGGAGVPGKSPLVGYKGGGGGGGGGGALGGTGGGGGSGGTLSSGGGGGAGSGNAYVSSSVSNATYSGGATGNGKVTLSWIDITTTGLPDAVNSESYTTTLAAAGGSGTYTWVLNNPSDLQAGLTWDAGTATISGTPSANGAATLSFTVTDTNGNQTSSSFVLDVVPNTAVVLDDAPTAVSVTTATGNGRVNPRGGSAVSSIYCKIATTEDTTSGTQVTATPSNVTGGSSSYTAFTCPFTGLAAGTQYYYDVFAVQGATTFNGSSPQTFTTEPLAAQTFNAPFPTKIKYSGTTQLLKKKSYTSAGKRVKVTLSKSSKAGYNNRGDMVLYTKITTKKSKVSVRTYGNKFYLRVTYSAPATSTAAAYKQTKVYLVRK